MLWPVDLKIMLRYFVSGFDVSIDFLIFRDIVEFQSHIATKFDLPYCD